MKGGKTTGGAHTHTRPPNASMRPAREGRENAVQRAHHDVAGGASMRPAREGRENGRLARKIQMVGKASMRPAREGRENFAAAKSGKTTQAVLQ